MRTEYINFVLDRIECCDRCDARKVNAIRQAIELSSQLDLHFLRYTAMKIRANREKTYPAQATCKPESDPLAQSLLAS